MFQLVLSHRFKKNLKDFFRKHPELRITFTDKITLLQNDPGHTKLRTHKLTGKLKNYLAISLTYEFRIVFSLKKDAIHLHAIGTYDEVY